MHFNSILFSDFDFTLYEHGSPEIFKENLVAINKWRDAGNYFVVATGRGEESLRSLFADYEQYCDFGIFCDGGIIKDSTGKLVYADRFGEDLSRRLTTSVSALDFGKDYAIICFSDNKEFPVIEAGTCKIRFWFESFEDCEQVQEVLDTQFANEIDYISYRDVVFNDDNRLAWVSPTMKHIIEVTRANTDKSTGIQKLLNTLSIHNRERIVTIGDGKNDLSMIKTFDGYVIESGDPTVVEQIVPGHRVPHLHDLITIKLLQH